VSPPGAPVELDPHQCASDTPGAYIGVSPFVAGQKASDRMVKAEKLDCCHTSRSRLLLAMEQPERNLNVEQLRKCARYFRALAAVPETKATARAELVHIAGQFEALAQQRTIDRLGCG
jgi:hypothetical protein